MVPLATMQSSAFPRLCRMWCGLTISKGAGVRCRLAFDPSKANERKEWLKASKADECVDCTKASLTYADFVHKELVQYSLSDNVRSIPSAVDGLKPSQRKVLFACLTRGLTKEMKVAQLAGYVAEKSCYHHGEKSLAAVIIGMAQVKRHVDHCSIVLHRAVT